jgi:hypothetical protein
VTESLFETGESGTIGRLHQVQETKVTGFIDHVDSIVTPHSRPAMVGDFREPSCVTKSVSRMSSRCLFRRTGTLLGEPTAVPFGERRRKRTALPGRPRRCRGAIGRTVGCRLCQFAIPFANCPKNRPKNGTDGQFSGIRRHSPGFPFVVTDAGSRGAPGVVDL